MEKPEFYETFDLCNIHMPVDYKKLEQLLVETNYDQVETEFLVDGFGSGFDVGYNGPLVCQSRAKNLPFTIGNKVELSNKLMKEVRLKRVAGPFKDIPYKNFIQSPIGLVPKAGKSKTRLIFHVIRLS